MKKRMQSTGVIAAFMALLYTLGQVMQSCSSEAHGQQNFIGTNRYVPPYPRNNRIPVNPNIVHILLDDADQNSFDAALANDLIPNIETFMVNGGTNFTESYAPNPWCCPARASEQCGLYSHTNLTFHNSTGLSAWNNWESGAGNVSLAEDLFSRSYYTGRIGKWLNGWTTGSQAPPRGFSFWQGMFNVDLSYDMDQYSFQVCTNSTGTGVSCTTATVPYTTQTPGTHQIDEFIDRTEAFIATATIPFVFFGSPTIPHVEHNAPGSYTNRQNVRRFRSTPATRWAGSVRVGGSPDGLTPIGGLTGPLDLPACVGAGTGAFDEADVTDKSQWITAGPNNEGEAPRIRDGCASASTGAVDDATGADIRLTWLDYLEQWRGVDDYIGAIRDALNARGLLGSTVVILTSDNGLMFGEHRTVLKMSAFEESIRVPLVVRGPGIRAGATRTEPVTTMDMATTVIELTGGGTSYVTDGRSLVPLLRSAAVPSPWRKAIVFEHFYADRSLPMDEFDIPDLRAIKTFSGHTHPNLKLIEYMSTGAAPYSCGAQNTLPWNNPTTCGKSELYDMATDPHELVNQEANASYDTAQAALVTQLLAMSTCSPTGTTCQSLEEQ